MDLSVRAEPSRVVHEEVFCGTLHESSERRQHESVYGNTLSYRGLSASAACALGVPVRPQRAAPRHSGLPFVIIAEAAPPPLVAAPARLSQHGQDCGGSIAWRSCQGRLATSWYPCRPSTLAVIGSVPLLLSAPQTLVWSASSATAPPWSTTTIP